MYKNDVGASWCTSCFCSHGWCEKVQGSDGKQTFLFFLTKVYLTGRLRLPGADWWIFGSSGHSTTSSDQSECAVHLQNCSSTTSAWWWRGNRLPQCSPRSLVAEAVLERRLPAAKKTPTDWPGLPPCLWHLCQIPWQAGPCWCYPLPGQYHLLTWCSQTCKPKCFYPEYKPAF